MRVLGAPAVRVLDDGDRDEVLALLEEDPVTNVFVSARIRAIGLRPRHLGAEVWGYASRGRIKSVCYSGANLVPCDAPPEIIAAFADRAKTQGRRCSSIVGPQAAVTQLWRRLEPSWGRPRAIRAAQPLLSMSALPELAADRTVRRVTREEFDILYPACVAMFTEEVGVSPLVGDGGALYRARVAELIDTGRSFARIEDGAVVFKAEIGAVTPYACQVQGVWVRPELRGHNIAAHGMAAVVTEALKDVAPVVSLYVNDFNAPARAAYAKVGFQQVGTFTSVLF